MTRDRNAVLTIGHRTVWRLRHEDNGAMHTALALSHLRLGLERTRWHDVFFNPGIVPSSFNGGNPVDPRRDPPRGTSELR